MGRSVGAVEPYILKASILTSDPTSPRAEAMAVAAGRVLAIGDVEDVRRVVGSGTRQVDLRDLTVIPGLIDSHNHMYWTGIQRRIVDLSACRSIADVQEAIRQYVATHPHASWIVSGAGWHVVNLAERRYPTRQELDAACSDRPVYLERVAHAAVANSCALALAGITRSTPNPDGGKIGRDPITGEPDGLLLEPPAFELVGRHVPAKSRQEQRAALRDIQQTYHAAGITGVIEPGLKPDEIALYQDAHADGELTVRTLMMPWVDSNLPLSHTIEQFSHWGVRTGFGDKFLRIGGLKLFVDGGASLGTALMREPHPDERCNCGIQVTPTEMFRGIAEFCASRRWSLGVHVVGGKAIDIALETFAEVNRRFPIRDLRFSLIHAYLWPSEANIRQARELGVTVATQPSMQYTFGGLLVDRFGIERMAEATPIRSWLDGGVVVGGGSDSPVTPYSPLLGMWQAMTRHIDGHELRVGPDQAVSPEEALAMYTRNAAFVAFAEHERGMLAPGMLADWVALSVDPITCDPEDLRDAEVVGTAVGGELVYGSL